MSIMQRTLNTALRFGLKPILFCLPFNHTTMAAPRAMINTLGFINTTTKGTSINEFFVEDMPAEWVQCKYEISDRKKCRVILYLHGGAYIVGGPKTHRAITSRLAKLNKARVLVIDYRQAPEHKFPAPQMDAVRAYRWLIEEEGYDPKNIIFAGDSAGGNLCVTAAIMIRDLGLPPPAALCLICPWLDLSSSGVSHTDNVWTDPYIPQARMREAARLYTDLDLTDPRISPVFADLKDLPPTMIHISDNEILLSDSENYYKAAREAGNDCTLTVYQDCCHVWQFFSGFDLVPEAMQSLREFSAFMKLHWKDPI